MAKTVSFLRQNEKLLGDLRSLILEARQDVARRVNSALVMLYWKVGQRIRKGILKEKRAEYGKQIVATLSRKLVETFVEKKGAGQELKKIPNFLDRPPYSHCGKGCSDTRLV